MNRLMWANPATQANVRCLRKSRRDRMSRPGRRRARPAARPAPAACSSPREHRRCRVRRQSRRTGRTLGGRKVRGHRGTHARTHRSRALHQQSQLRKDGLRASPTAARDAGARRGHRQRTGQSADAARRDSASTWRRAEQMLDAVLAHVVGADIFIAAAAVSDYRRAQAVGASKIKKTPDALTIELARTAGHPRPRSPRARQPARSSSASPPRPRTSSRTRWRSCERRTST